MHKNATSIQWNLLPVLLLSFFLPACNSDNSKINTSAPAPTVSSTSPADAATTIERNNIIITATFNEDMFAITVDETSFTLAKPDDSTISGNVSFDGAINVASFTPNSSLDILTTYTATLSNNITNLKGNGLNADYSWFFTTADGVWGNAEPIENNVSEGVGSPQIAFDKDGNAISVWMQSDGTLRNIWANRFNGTSWGNAVLIETNNVGNASSPQIAIDINGNAIAVWQQTDNTRYNIWANYYDGSSWGTPEIIETDNSGDASRPQIAIGNNGNAIAVWSQSDGTRNNIWTNRFNGSSWSSATLLETDNVGTALFPQIAIDNKGNAFAVWQQFDGNSYNIWVNRYDGISWGGTTLIHTDNTESGTTAQIAIDNSGKAIVVWQQLDGIRYSIWANDYNANSWGNATLIETDNAGDAFNAQLAFDNNGNALAVWQQSDGTRNNIWANHFNGSNWGSATLIETNNSASANRPQITFDNNGTAFAIWSMPGEIWANRFDGNNWSSATLINADISGYADKPQVAFDNSGKAIAVWLQSDGPNTNIWANRFE